MESHGLYINGCLVKAGSVVLLGKQHGYCCEWQCEGIFRLSADAQEETFESSTSAERTEDALFFLPLGRFAKVYALCACVEVPNEAEAGGTKQHTLECIPSFVHDGVLTVLFEKLPADGILKIQVCFIDLMVPTPAGFQVQLPRIPLLDTGRHQVTLSCSNQLSVKSIASDFLSVLSQEENNVFPGKSAQAVKEPCEQVVRLAGQGLLVSEQREPFVTFSLSVEAPLKPLISAFRLDEGGSYIALWWTSDAGFSRLEASEVSASVDSRDLQVEWFPRKSFRAVSGETFFLLLGRFWNESSDVLQVKLGGEVVRCPFDFDKEEHSTLANLLPSELGRRSERGISLFRYELVKHLRQFGHRFLLSEKRPPTATEVAEELSMSLHQALVLLKLTQSPYTKVPQASEETMEDFLNESFPGKEVLSAASRRVLDTLTDREKKVLRLRFGIGETSEHTLEEVGEDFVVTRERIRPIDAKTLRKLRHPSRAKKLKPFIEDEAKDE